MKSHEVLRDTMQEIGVKSLAADMGLSTSLLYKWCEPNETDTSPGTDNPLDRLLKICRITGNIAPVEWLCRETNGFRVDNPELSEDESSTVLKSTQRMLKEFSEVLEAVSQSYDNGRRISCEEAARIRKEWEDLKIVAESFVFACESGTYDTPDA